MVAPVHNLDPTILPEGSAKLRLGGGEGKGQSSIEFYLFLGVEKQAAKLRWAGGRAAPCWAWQSPKRRVRAAHGRAREAKTH
jgi:hypothetical protein